MFQISGEEQKIWAGTDKGSWDYVIKNDQFWLVLVYLNSSIGNSLIKFNLKRITSNKQEKV